MGLTHPLREPPGYFARRCRTACNLTLAPELVDVGSQFSFTVQVAANGLTSTKQVRTRSE